MADRSSRSTLRRAVERVTAAAIVGATAAVVATRIARARRRANSSEPATAAALDGPAWRLSSARARRTAELARVGARTGASLAAAKARSVGASDERKAEIQAEFELRSAEQVAEVLGNMKGAVMKLGQMASYLDQAMPEPVREALAQLQADAPPMSYELVTDVIRGEFGRGPEDVFASFEVEPLAAASIGQVHRAVTHDGRAVAVKVQYPGVDQAIRSDLENTDLLFSVMGMLFPGMDPKPIVGEIGARLVEELDYRNEASNQHLFADYYVGHPTIAVPDVVDELSGARVLATTLATGASWAELATWSQHEKDLAAETIYRYAFGGIYRLSAFNGDPHPGNYLFEPGGRVTFLDYGLCKIFEPGDVDVFEDMIRAIVFDRDIAAFRAAIVGGGMLAADNEFTDDEIFDYFRHFYEFVLEDEVQTMTPEYASEGIRRYFDLSGPHAEIIKAANLPPPMIIVQRINLGLFALLGELGATANWRRIAEEIWPWVLGPPSTPAGEAIAEWERTSCRSTG